MRITLFFLSTALVMMLSSGVVSATDRALEIKEEMWNSPDKDFKAVTIPEKWKDKSAVIIAQLHRFEYKKALMASLLKINQYSHYRIKLIDKNAISKYTEITYNSDETYGATGLKVYVGFKVIKPDGKEIVVSLSNAVKMERSGGGQTISYYKMAVPSLEPGDILDYYICEESVILKTSEIQFFDPVIYNLPQEYPVMKQKLHFRAQRKCYINLRSMNGAPELKLVNDEANDEQYYSLEDGDREGIADVKWLYPNRELPTIKFRATYASGKGLMYYNVLLGKQGEVKNSVHKAELARLTQTLMTPVYSVKHFSKYMKAKQPALKDPFEIAKAAYYFYRNQLLAKAEIRTIMGGGPYTISDVEFTDVFSTFLDWKKIDHDIIVCVPRNISAIDDVVLENELRFLIRVKKGAQYMYFSPLTIFTNAGMLYPRIEGTDAYALDGLADPMTWWSSLQRITIPTTKKEDNISESVIKVTTTDFSIAKMSATHSLKGYNKLFWQSEFLDLYDVLEEDNKRFDPYVSFKTYAKSDQKRLAAKKVAYNEKRKENRLKDLKTSLEGEFDFKIKDVENYNISKLGRFEADEEVEYSFDFTTEELFRKTGANYLMDIGKLIEKQVKIEDVELERNFNVYFENARAFRYKVIFEIPEGYQVQGIEKLNMKSEHAAGGFVSSAIEKDGKVIVETFKYYNGNFVDMKEWKNVVAFLNAANNFSDQKLLLKKK
jgi:hypothetical protein